MLYKLEDNSRTDNSVDSESIWWVRSCTHRNCHEKLRESIHCTELQRLSFKLNLPLKQWFGPFEDKYTTLLLSWPTFKQALPHFLCLIAEPGAIGEIQREAGFRQRILHLLVVHHERGRAVHGAKDLEGEEEMHLC